MKKTPIVFVMAALAGALHGQMLEITSSGVGIGESSPASLLHVKKTGDAVQFVARFESGDGTGTNDVPVVELIAHSSIDRGAQIAANPNGVLAFLVNATPETLGTEAMRLDQSGNVGIGTSSPGYKLTVSGSVRATSFISDVTTYSDFVFQPGYKLRPLGEVEMAIKREGHLPDIPGEAEMKAHGVDLASQQAKLLQKVEELTLYVIDLKKENEELRQRMARIESAAAR